MAHRQPSIGPSTPTLNQMQQGRTTHLGPGTGTWSRCRSWRPRCPSPGNTGQEDAAFGYWRKRETWQLRTDKREKRVCGQRTHHAHAAEVAHKEPHDTEAQAEVHRQLPVDHTHTRNDARMQATKGSKACHKLPRVELSGRDDSKRAGSKCQALTTGRGCGPCSSQSRPCT